MKKPLSMMTSQDFAEAMAALGLDGRRMALALERTPSMVTRYMNGAPVPLDVAERIQQLLKARQAEVANAIGMTNASIGSMIIFTNERKRPPIHQTLGRLMRRQKPRPDDSKVYPVYRMTQERFEVYIRALSLWQQRIRELARIYVTEAHQRDYRLEMANVKLLAEGAPRHAPYDIHIERGQWKVVSRALKYAHSLEPTGASNAVLDHWLRHKGSGYYSARSYPGNTPTPPPFRR